MFTSCSLETHPWAIANLKRCTYQSPIDGFEDWALALPCQNDAFDLSPTAQPHPIDRHSDSDKKNTWVIVLHGHGSTGDQLYTRQDIRQSWLPEFTTRNFGILTPNLRGNAWMSHLAVADLHGLIRYLRQYKHADRIILAGGSMGGTGCLIYASIHPEEIDGVLALCPATDLPSYFNGCSQRLQTPVLQAIHEAISQHYFNADHAHTSLNDHSALARASRFTMPLFLVHGSADPVIPVEQSRQLAKTLENKPDFCYIEQPEGHHDSPLTLFSQGLSWVLEHLHA